MLSRACADDPPARVVRHTSVEIHTARVHALCLPGCWPHMYTRSHTPRDTWVDRIGPRGIRMLVTTRTHAPPPAERTAGTRAQKESQNRRPCKPGAARPRPSARPRPQGWAWPSWVSRPMRRRRPPRPTPSAYTSIVVSGFVQAQTASFHF